MGATCGIENPSVYMGQRFIKVMHEKKLCKRDFTF